MVHIRLETPSEEKVSKVYGPFPFAQLTYNGLRVGPDGDHFAVIWDDGFWHLVDQGDEQFVRWSDIIISEEPGTV